MVFDFIISSCVGETVLAKLKANNTSVKPTRRIRIKVHHKLELRAHGHSKHLSRVDYEQEFPGFEPCFYGVKYVINTISLLNSNTLKVDAFLHSNWFDSPIVSPR